MRVNLAISGRNYDAAKALPRHLDLPEGCRLDEAIGTLAALFPSGQRLPDSCLVAVSGVHLGTLGKHRAHQLKDGDELLLIAPVAGG